MNGLQGRRFRLPYYHNELGWLLNNAQFKDGVDGSFSTYTYAEE